MKRFWVAVFFAGCLGNIPLSAQNPGSSRKDTLTLGRDTTQISCHKFELTEAKQRNLLPLKYDLDWFQLYQPVFRHSLINTNLANNGTAWQSQDFKLAFSKGFNYGFNAFDLYYLQPKDVLFYDTKSPYTAATYIQGPQEEINFKILHTQNISKAFNFAVNYQRLSSQGQYNRQSNNHNALQLNFWYRPLHSGYQLLVAGTYNNGLCQENAGLSRSGDSLLRDNLESNRSLLQVNLTGADQKIFGNGFMLRQTYDIGPGKIDSLHHKYLFRLQHSLNYTYKKNTFRDILNNPGFYAEIIDSGLYAVAYENKHLENEIALLGFSGKADSTRDFAMDTKAFLKQQFIHSFMPIGVLNEFYDLKTTNQSGGGFFRFSPFEKLKFKLEAEYFFSGFNANDYLFNASFVLGPKNKWAFELGTEASRQEASFQSQRFISNFSRWDHNFNKISQTIFFARYLNAKRNLNAEVSNRFIDQFVLLGQDGKPFQATSDIQILRASLDHRLHVCKWHLFSRLLYQHCNNSSLIRLPSFQVLGSLFREGKLKGKTTFRTGIDVMAASEYIPGAYQPFSGLFYLQDSITNKAFYQVDAYVSAKIKRVLLFVKSENVSSLWNKVYISPVAWYPVNRMAFKIGLSWVFYD